jgi:hypothetical protein
MEKVKNLIPYSVYLPKEYHDRISELAKERKASGLIRDAICMILDGSKPYRAGYNQAIRDAVKTVGKIQYLDIIAIKGRYIDNTVTEQLEMLEKVD